MKDDDSEGLENFALIFIVMMIMLVIVVYFSERYPPTPDEIIKYQQMYNVQ